MFSCFNWFYTHCSQDAIFLPGARPTVRGTMTQIFRENGFRGFYKGLSAQLARDIPASATYFLTYEYTRRLIRSSSTSPEWLNSLISGALAGWVSWFVPLPFDVIKTRLQSGKEKTFMACLNALRAEGPASFFAGLGLVSVRAFLVNGVTFLGYEIAILELSEANASKPLITSSTTAGSQETEKPKKWSPVRHQYGQAAELHQKITSFFSDPFFFVMPCSYPFLLIPSR